MNDSNLRSIVKTISWRLTGSGATFLIVLLISGNLSIAGPIAITQLIVNTLLYYIHERVWNIINWERKVKTV
jgi:uncharacterized membrane protein